MGRPDESRALVLRVWEHGGRRIAKVIVASDDPRPPIHLVGDEAILSWLDEFVRDGLPLKR